MLISCAEIDANTENPDNSTDYATAVPAIGNPEYFDKDADNSRTAPGVMTGIVDDEGSYLTCGGSAGDYYNYNNSGAQLIAA